VPVGLVSTEPSVPVAIGLTGPAVPSACRSNAVSATLGLENDPFRTAAKAPPTPSARPSRLAALFVLESEVADFSSRAAEWVAEHGVALLAPIQRSLA
jgi:hypothetical protein